MEDHARAVFEFSTVAWCEEGINVDIHNIDRRDFNIGV